MLLSSPPLELDEVTSYSRGAIGSIRVAVLDVVFSRDSEFRRIKKEYLVGKFNENLRRCYVDGDNVMLDLQDDSCLMTVRVAKIPRKFMDMGQYSLSIT